METRTSKRARSASPPAAAADLPPPEGNTGGSSSGGGGGGTDMDMHGGEDTHMRGGGDEDIMRIVLPDGETFEVSKANLDRHPKSLLRLMRDSEIPCSHDDQGAIQMTLPGNVSAMAFATALDEYNHILGHIGAPLRGPINPVELYALYDFLMLPPLLLSMERGRPNTPIDVLAGQAALHRGLSLAQELECFVRALACPRLFRDAGHAILPTLPDGTAEGAAVQGTASMALLFYLEDELVGIDQLHPTRGDIYKMKEHELIRRQRFSSELFELLKCPARLQWVVRTFLPHRVDELRLLRARACNEADLALKPLVLQPKLLTGMRHHSSLTRWSGNHSHLTVARHVGVFAVRFPIIEALNLVSRDQPLRQRMRRNRPQVRELVIPDGPISGVQVFVYPPDEDDATHSDGQSVQGGFSVYIEAWARGPTTASIPVLGVAFYDMIGDDDEEEEAEKLQARKVFFHDGSDGGPSRPDQCISNFLPSEEAEQRFMEAGGALGMAQNELAEGCVVASPNGCLWAAEVASVDCYADKDSDSFRELLAADAALFPEKRSASGLAQFGSVSQEALASDAMHRAAFKTVLITLSELQPDAHPALEAYYARLDRMQGSAGENPDNFLIVEVGSGVS